MTNKFSVLFKKYSVPVLLLTLGVVLLIIGISKDQGPMFMLSAVLMFIAGGLSLLYSSGKMKTLFLVIFGVLAGIAGIVMLAVSWTEVSTEIATQERNDMLLKTSKQNLEDVIYIQKEYQERNGIYAGSWEEVTDFVKNGTVDYVFSEGSVPNRKLIREESDFLYNDNRPLDFNMTEDEAYRLSKWAGNPNSADFEGFRRDTVQVSLLKSKFQSRSYLEARKLSGVGTFYPDSLRYIPMTKGKEEWAIATVDSLLTPDSTYAPAIEVKGTLPYLKKDMSFGSLTSPKELGGSWENE
ncbi:MAG: hypothetical protein AB8B56_14960 [Crocinitomicaceae bacterium]